MKNAALSYSLNAEGDEFGTLVGNSAASLQKAGLDQSLQVGLNGEQQTAVLHSPVGGHHTDIIHGGTAGVKSQCHSVTGSKSESSGPYIG